MPEAPEGEGAADLTDVQESMLAAVQAWYEGKRRRGGSVNTNVMNVGLIMTDHMASGMPLVEADYLVDSQVKGLSGAKIGQILAKYGEERKFTREGGRTSRNTRPMAQELAQVLSTAAAASGYGSLSEDDQAAVREGLQRYFAERVQEDYFDRQRLEAELDPRLPARVAVAALLESAKTRPGNFAGAVAQHLVGAKLSLRFPEVEVVNESYTTADQQTSRSGDFQVGDTAFHVTMAPSEALMSSRCAENLRHGVRPVVLVPEGRVLAARQLAETAGINKRIAVLAIEDFVGTNVEEMGDLSEAGIKSLLAQLLARYNDRVRAIESDPSLLIDIPTHLQVADT